MRILLLVDIQRSFSLNASQAFFKRVKREINLFKKNEEPIVSVTMGVTENLIDSIAGQLFKYPKVMHVVKNHVDGGYDVAKIIDNQNWQFDEILVSGMYTCECVFQTARSLGEIYTDKKVIIDKKLCHCHHIYRSDCVRPYTSPYVCII